MILITALKWFTTILAIALITGFIFERYSRWKLEKEISNDKTFVSIDGSKLHYVKKGKGNCTVVFESGLAGDAVTWQEVQNKLGLDVVTLAYDRHGMFLSEAANTERTNAAISTTLFELLEQTKCPKPYIVVGHSMGAIYLRNFIAAHTKDVSGIVFVEAAHPLQMRKASPKMLKALAQPPNWLVGPLIETGLFRLFFSFEQAFPEIPLTHFLHQHFKNFFYKSYQGVFKEGKNDTINFQDAEKYPSFGNIPLTVIKGMSHNWTEGMKDSVLRAQFHQLTDELQHDLLSLSSRSKFVKAVHSGHMVQVNDAALIAKEINNIITIKKGPEE